MPSIINATTSTGLVTTADNSGELRLQTNSGNTAMTITTAQRVGIGTSSPARTLDVLGGSNTQFRVSSTGAEANMTLNGTSYGQINNAVGDLYISTDASSSNMILRTNGGFERMRITGNGNVLVGATALTTTEQMLIQSAVTTNSRITLTVYNTTATSTTRASSTLIRVLANGTSADSSMVFSDNSTYNVFMGGNNGQAFVIANTGGVFLGSGATSWSGISDARLKNVTGTYTNALNDIAQLEPVKFTWKSDTENKPQVGIIAQSVQKVVPEAVETTFEGDDPTEYLGVRYTELIPLLTAAIQELKGIVETQKAELDATKAEVAALKGAQ